MLSFNIVLIDWRYTLQLMAPIKLWNRSIMTLVSGRSYQGFSHIETKTVKLLKACCGRWCQWLLLQPNILKVKRTSETPILWHPMGLNLSFIILYSCTVPLEFYRILSTYSSQTSPLLKWKPLCHLPFAKGKTGSGCFLKICFCKRAATFLAFYWYRCGHFLRGKLALVKGWLLFWDPFKIELATFLKLTLVKVWLLFLDPFEIGVATFLEISISNCVFHI